MGLEDMSMQTQSSQNGKCYAIYVSIDAAQIDKALGSFNYGASVSD